MSTDAARSATGAGAASNTPGANPPGSRQGGTTLVPGGTNFPNGNTYGRMYGGADLGALGTNAPNNGQAKDEAESRAPNGLGGLTSGLGPTINTPGSGVGADGPYGAPSNGSAGGSGDTRPISRAETQAPVDPRMQFHQGTWWYLHANNQWSVWTGTRWASQPTTGASVTSGYRGEGGSAVDAGLTTQAGRSAADLGAGLGPNISGSTGGGMSSSGAGGLSSGTTNASSSGS
jgi:hypothetical protein